MENLQVQSSSGINSSMQNYHDSLLQSYKTIQQYFSDLIQKMVDDEPETAQFIQNLLDVRDYVQRNKFGGRIIFPSKDLEMQNKLIYLKRKTSEFQKAVYNIIKTNVSDVLENKSLKVNMDKHFLGERSDFQMIYETLFIVSLSRITFDSNHPTLDKCCLSLLNGMIFDIVRKNNRLIPYDGDIQYEVVIVNHPMPSFIEMSSQDYEILELDEKTRLTYLSTYNSGTLINRYFHPHDKQLKLSTSSSVFADNITHPLLIEENNKYLFIQGNKISQFLPQVKSGDKLVYPSNPTHQITQSYIVFTNITHKNRQNYQTKLPVYVLMWKFDNQNLQECRFFDQQCLKLLEDDSNYLKKELQFQQKINYNTPTGQNRFPSQQDEKEEQKIDPSDIKQQNAYNLYFDNQQQVVVKVANSSTSVERLKKEEHFQQLKNQFFTTPNIFYGNTQYVNQQKEYQNYSQNYTQNYTQNYPQIKPQTQFQNQYQKPFKPLGRGQPRNQYDNTKKF